MSNERARMFRCCGLVSAALFVWGCQWGASSPASPPPSDAQCEVSPRTGCWTRVDAGEAILGAQASEPDGLGYHPDAADDEGPVRRVAMPSMWIMRDELTASAWRACVKTGNCEASEADADGPLSTLASSRAKALPLNGVTYRGATQVCAWLGGRLPTADEWEYAARGTDGRPWPWGSEPGCGVRAHRGPPVSIRQKGVVNGGYEMMKAPCTQQGPASSNDMPPGPIRGMGGSLWEWTQAVGTQPGERILRGGGWLEEDPVSLRTTARLVVSEDAKLPDVGVRCIWGG